jgi:hypothetical protein
LALGCVELAIILGPAVLRVPAGVLLGLILPGLVIAPLLSRPGMERVERILLVPGISLAIVIMTGLLLAAAGIGLGRISWALALGVVTGCPVMATSVRRHRRAPQSGAPAPGRGREAWGLYRRPRMRLGMSSLRPAARILRSPRLVASAVLVGLAAAGGTAAFAVSLAGDRYRGPGFTELWALPGPDAAPIVRLGVISHERHDVRYRVRVVVSGRQVQTSEVGLAPGEAWTAARLLTRPGTVNVWLEREPSAAVYRHVEVSVSFARVSRLSPRPPGVAG